MARVTVTYSLRDNNFNTAARTMAVDSHANGLVGLTGCLSKVCINASSLTEVDAVMHRLMLVVNRNFSGLFQRDRRIIDDRRWNIDVIG